jgi:predicted nucleotidyltransferase component of viral defense system
MVQILKDISTDIAIAGNLGFKGGSALMFFYDLPRFSVDLDFNLINNSKEEFVFQKIRDIVLKYGTIHDEAIKHYGVILVVNYGTGERKLKIEISNRNFKDKYEIKSFLGIPIKVMTQENMFAHKLCALLDRSSIANRDIFDCWFFMNRQTPVNRSIIEHRMGMPYQEYLQNCIDYLEKNKNLNILQGLGELMDPEMKTFVRNKLKDETINFLRFYKEFPIVG